MNFASSLSLRYKLPMAFIGLSIMSGITLQAINQVGFSKAISSETESVITAVATSQSHEFHLWLDGASRYLAALAQGPQAAAAVQQIGATYAQFDDPATELRDIFAPGSASAPEAAADGATSEFDLTRYRAAHGSAHSYLDPIRSIWGYSDILLVDPDLNVIYTAVNDADFATNMETGPYASSDLGVLLREVRDSADGRVHISDFASYAPANGQTAAFMAIQIVDRTGSVVGIIAARLNVSRLEGVTSVEEELGSSSAAYLVGSDFLARTRVRGMDGSVEFSALPQVIAAAAGEKAYFDGVPLARGGIGMVSVVPITGYDQAWSLVVERDENVALAISRQIFNQILVAAAVLGSVLLVLGSLFARTIVRPVSRMKDAVERMAGGDYDVEVQDVGRGDELGGVARALVVLKDALVSGRAAETQRREESAGLERVVSGLRAGLHDLSEGNLASRIETQFPANYEILRSDFNQTATHLSETMSQVVLVSQSIHAKAGEISGASEDLSRRTENQAAALEETAAALDEMTSSVKSAADGAREVETIVQNARTEAENSGIVVQGAVKAMTKIRESSDQISQIIGAIDDIAFQTNLLALNAGVEAARAGEAGKGFAVVASEVRALAQRSSAAAKEIKTLIIESAEHVGTGVEQVGRAGEALTSIVGSVANITSLVGGIATGAAEQSAGLAEINIGVTQLDQVTQQNAAMVEQATAAGHSLQQDAKRLAEMVAQFRVQHSEMMDSNIVEFPSHRLAAKPEINEPRGEIGAEEMIDLRAGAKVQGVWQDF